MVEKLAQTVNVARCFPHYKVATVFFIIKNLTITTKIVSEVVPLKSPNLNHVVKDRIESSVSEICSVWEQL